MMKSLYLRIPADLQNSIKKHLIRMLRISGTIAMLSLLHSGTGYAQIILFKPAPQAASVCQEQTLAFQMVHTGAGQIGETLVTLELPCGFEYRAGTISGLQEEEISELQRPVFRLADWSTGEEIAVQLEVIITCQAADCLNAGNLFFMNAVLTYDGTSQSFQSDAFTVQTPLLVIVGVQDQVMTGYGGQTLTRTYSIRNTRFGRLASFLFEDTFEEGILVQVAQGEDEGSTSDRVRRRIGGMEFLQIGNKDEWLDFGEVITITETITILACPQEKNKVASAIGISWGCLGASCQSAAYPSVILIASGGQAGSVHEVLSELHSPQCKSDTAVLQSFILRDTSQFHDLLNVQLRLRCQGPSIFFLSDGIQATLNGITYLPKSSDTIKTNCGKTTLRIIDFEFPLIRAGEEVTIHWEQLFCKTEKCQPSINGIEWHLFYEKACADVDDRFFTLIDWIPTSVTGSHLTGELSLTQPDLPTLTDSTAFEFQLKASSEKLLENDYSLIIQFRLPCGVHITDTTLSIDGKSPVYKYISSTEGPAEILLEYTTPFSSENVTLFVPAIFFCDTSCMEDQCEQVLVSTCPQNCIFESRVIQISSQISLTDDLSCPEEGLDFICLNLPAAMQCFTEVCIDTLAGYFHFESTLQRISLGLPDNDNDYKADPQGDLDMSLIRLDRIVPGDSIKIESSGRIRTDGRDTTFDHLILTYRLSKSDEFQIEPERALFETNRMIHPDSGFVNYLNRLTILPSGSNTPFTVSVPGSFDPLTWKYLIHMDLAAIKAANPTFPKDYRFSDLDSLHLVSFFLLAHNPRSYPPFTNNSITLTNLINAHLFSGPVLPEDDRSDCICRTVRLEVGNLNYIIGRNAREFELCQDTLENYSLFFSLGSLSNFFPFEYRQTYDHWEPLFIPASNFTIASARISLINVNGSVFPVQIPIPIPPLTNDGYLFDLDSLTKAYKEENLLIFLLFDLVSSVCQRPEGNTMPLQTRTVIAPYHLRRKNQRLTVSNNLLLSWQWTNPEPEIAICNQTFFNNRTVWQLQITNCHKNTLGLTAIPNLYLRTEHDPKAMTSLGLTILNNGQAIPLENGFYHIGSLAECDTLHLELHGTNQSCDTEDIRIWVGWGCKPDAPYTEPCAEKEFHCSFISAPGLLELAVDEQPISAALCDTMPHTRILYLNADLGAAYQIKSVVQLPAGLQYVPGSALIRWPQQSGPAITLPDPVFLPDNHLAWELHQYLPTSDFVLPGVLSDPENGLELFFQTFTTCDFISGSRIIVTYEGRQVCLRPTNQLARVSGPYHIQGVEVPYSTQIGVTTAQHGGCSNLVSVSIQVLTDAIEGLSDKLELALPPGFQLLPGSIQSNLSNPTPTWESGRWFWKLEPGLPVTTLELVLQLEESAACTPSILSIFTSIPVKAFCAGADSFCTIGVMTGNRFLPLQLSRQAYEVRDMEPLLLQGSRGLRAEILQTGGTLPGSGIAELYLDLDGDGQLSPGDQWLAAQAFTIGPDSTVTLSFFPIELPREQWCRIILVLDPEKNCMCAPVISRLPGPVRLPFFENLELCWLGEAAIGPTPQPEVSYHWQGAHISCSDCAMTEFSAPNTGSFTTFHLLVLYESWPGGCALELEYLIQVEPKPGIIPPFQTICPGDSAVLTATGGSAFQWEGPSLLNSSSQTVIATPPESATYILRAEDALGCKATDTAYVEVIAFSVNPAGPDQQLCLGSEARLQAVQVPGYGYHWINAQGRLDDPFRPDPAITVQESFVFILEVSFGFCRQYDSVAVVFSSSPFPGFLPDTIEVCAGDTLVLSLPNSHTYAWQPNFIGLCQNPACSEVSIPVLQAQEFLIEATDSAGCLTTHRLYLIPQQDTATTQFAITLCAGGQFILGGDTILQPGNYCDTTVSSSGCIRISCYAISFSPIPNFTSKDTFCTGGFYIYFGDTLWQAGLYCDTIPNPDGCLEAYCLDLFTRMAPPDTISGLLCPGEFLVFYGDTIEQAGTYCVTFTGSGSCDSTVCLVVVQDSMPVILLPFMDSVLCPGDTLWIDPEIIPSHAAFQWQDGYPQLARPVFVSGTYVLTIRDSCDQTTSAVFTIRYPDSLMVTLGSDTTLCLGDTLFVSPQVTGGDYTWMWLDGYPDWERVLYEAGLYVLQLTDACGNIYLDSLALSLESCAPCKVEIPNLFTPNGDGSNDIFRLVTECPLPNARMKIYNRWGQVLYEGHPVQPGWNGEFQGKAQPMEVYAYVIEYSDTIEGVKVLRGDVTLLR
jgi:gliding motility-associated-like protein